MPSRVVSDALWSSHKLKKVPVQYRAEYANLIPLAEVNGAFEADPELVWSKVYSFNRNDVTPDIVAEILDEFEKADMLQRYVVDGKTYGYWTGIDKPGRLPPKYERAKYSGKNLPPAPIVADQTPSSEVSSPDVGCGGTRLIGMSLENYIVSECERAVGFSEDKKLWNKELKAAIKQHGHDAVLKAFDNWISCALPFSGRKPITVFIKSISSSSSVQSKISSPALQEVETQIALISDNSVFFMAHLKPLLAALVQQYSQKEVVEAFQAFWNDFGQNDNLAFAAKTFVDQAAVRMDAVRKNKQQEIETKNQVIASVASAQLEAENELEQQEIFEEEL